MAEAASWSLTAVPKEVRDKFCDDWDISKVSFLLRSTLDPKGFLFPPVARPLEGWDWLALSLSCFSDSAFQSVSKQNAASWSRLGLISRA